MKQFLVLNEKNEIVSPPFNSLGIARGFAYDMARENMPLAFYVYSYDTITKTIAKTKHGYMANQFLPSPLGKLVHSQDDCLRG